VLEIRSLPLSSFNSLQVLFVAGRRSSRNKLTSDEINITKDDIKVVLIHQLPFN
jgi:hypothetical protein